MLCVCVFSFCVFTFKTSLFFFVFLQFNDQLISPKQFVHLAGKATLKDWKRAIRLGGVMLRYPTDKRKKAMVVFFCTSEICASGHLNDL